MTLPCTRSAIPVFTHGTVIRGFAAGETSRTHAMLRCAVAPAWPPEIAAYAASGGDGPGGGAEGLKGQPVAIDVSPPGVYP